MSNYVVYLETTTFFYAPPVPTSQEDEDEWLVYQVTRGLTKQSDDVVPLSHDSFIEHQLTIVPSVPDPSVLEPAPSALARLPIIQVYSRRQETSSNTYPASVSSSSDPPLDDLPENLELPIALRKGIRTCKSTYPIANYVFYDHLSDVSSSLIAFLDSIFVPETVKEALSHPGWRDAMLEEIHALDENHT
ncbi:hypothetical protein A4A49_33936 [Nicotiana attenuata]|uniref:Mitochondrial protein n=1 Tax=Nicotiana attenuata TaxID=49451 RepID=A0A1J6KC57_NICAT|nr:hypothetical protein A4A49_33936 [Nicotiana attenuata]